MLLIILSGVQRAQMSLFGALRLVKPNIDSIDGTQHGNDVGFFVAFIFSKFQISLLKNREIRLRVSG